MKKLLNDVSFITLHFGALDQCAYSTFFQQLSYFLEIVNTKIFPSINNVIKITKILDCFLDEKLKVNLGFLFWMVWMKKIADQSGIIMPEKIIYIFENKLTSKSILVSSYAECAGQSIKSLLYPMNTDDKF